MLWSLDTQGAVAHVSREWKQFTGFEDIDILGKSSRPTVHPEDRHVVGSIIRRAVDKRESFLLRFRSKNARIGQYSWVKVGAIPSFSPIDGRFIGYLGDTQIMKVAPQSEKAIDALQREDRSDQHIVLLDALAEHIMAARSVAVHTDDLLLKKMLDFALMSIGDLLYKSLKSD